MILATFLAPLFIPMFFHWMASVSEWFDRKRQATAKGAV
jgi:multidrug efflux pump